MKQIFNRKINYYETDKMGVVHHSNYVRFFEEARVDLMDKLGFSYKKAEELGIIIPIINYEVNIKIPAKFDDNMKIITTITKYNGIRMNCEYKIFISDKLIATGKTGHCFTNSEIKPIRLEKMSKELDEIIKKEIEER